MKKYILIMPIVLLLFVCSVQCVDLYKMKRVPRQDQEGQTINSNHPPLVDTSVPVSVIYDEEDISAVNKSIKQVKSTTTENGVSIKNNSDNNRAQSITKADELYGNYFPTADKHITIPSEIKTYDKNTQVTPSVESDDQESPSADDPTSTIKPKGRSLAYKPPATTTEIESSTKKNKGKVRDQRRRLQRVNKLGVNKTLSTDNQQSELQSGKIDETNKNSVESTTSTSFKGRTEQRVNKERTNKTPPIGNKKTGGTQIQNNETEIKPRKSDETQKINDTNTKFQKRTQQRKAYVPIIESKNFVYAHNGDFHYSYEGGDGTKAFERGELKTVDGGSSGAGVVGGFSYTDKDGNDFSLSYTADENGYRPVGAHLPTPPPIPIAIQRALALLATKTTPEPVTKKVKPY